MSDPIRLREEGDVPRAMLDRLTDLEPPPGVEERVLAAVLAQRATQTPPAFPRWIRFGLIGLACLGAVLLGVKLFTHDGPTAPSAVAVATATPTATAVAPPTTVETTAATVVTTATPPASVLPTATAHPHASTPLPSASVDTASLLREESAMIAKARGELRDGDPGAALATLAEAEKKFPQGVLAQEREALTIEAILRSGRTDEAKTRTAAFAERYPQSPHTARLQRMMP